MWGVRPHADVYKSLVHFLQHSGGELQCGIGIQTAAKGFFGRRRADPMRFDPRSADVDRHSIGAAPWATFNGKGPSPQAKLPSPSLAFPHRLASSHLFSPPPLLSSSLRPQAERRKIFTDPRMRPWEIMQLHTGYNLKANQGPMGCLRKHRHK